MKSPRVAVFATVALLPVFLATIVAGRTGTNPLCEVVVDPEGLKAPPTDIRQFEELDLDAACVLDHILQLCAQSLQRCTFLTHSLPAR